MYENYTTLQKPKTRKWIRTLQNQKEAQRGKIVNFIKKIGTPPQQKHNLTNESNQKNHAVNNINKVKLFTTVAIQKRKKHKIKKYTIIIYNTTYYINLSITTHTHTNEKPPHPQKKQ